MMPPGMLLCSAAGGGSSGYGRVRFRLRRQVGRAPLGSTSVATTHSGRTLYSTEAPQQQQQQQQRPFVVRNGRSYMADATLHYPLPVDLAELHHQHLRTLLLFQLFGRPVCSSRPGRPRADFRACSKSAAGPRSGA